MRAFGSGYQLGDVLESEPYGSFLSRRATRLSEVVEEELYRLQFPSLRVRAPRGTRLADLREIVLGIDARNPDELTRSACSNARRLTCNINKACGFGCQAHHMFFCMVMAYGSNRTLHADVSHWSYARLGWEGARRDCMVRSLTSKRWLKQTRLRLCVGMLCFQSTLCP